jgi:hypothetical protein
MVGAYGTYWGREVRAGFWLRNLRESDFLEDLVVYGRIDNNEIQSEHKVFP